MHTHPYVHGHSWFFGSISRANVEKKLLQAGNPQGTFLLCDNESHPGDFSLSIRDLDTVKHYRIRKTHEGKCIEYYVNNIQSVHVNIGHGYLDWFLKDEYLKC